MKRSILIIIIGELKLYHHCLIGIVVFVWARIRRCCLKDKDSWWTERDAGLIGGIGGQYFGLLGGANR